MSSSASKTNGTSTPTSLDTDIALLSSLLRTSQNGNDDSELSQNEVAELLRRMDAADGVARGVESRLDELIGSLDQMLGGIDEALPPEPSVTILQEANGDLAEQTRNASDADSASEEKGG